MTLAEYLDNPMGKGDSSLPNKQMILVGLNAKYDSLISKKEKEFKLHAYQNPYASEVYFHLVIPTETDRDNTYDVVFRFFDPDRKHKGELSIRNYEVQMFSNTPSFAYTFAYVYNQYGLMIPMFQSKLGDQIFGSAPVVRNKFEIVNFDKYLFFGAKFLLDSKWYLNRAYLDTNARPLKEEKLLRDVRSLKTIRKEYDEAAARLRKEKRYVKETGKRKTGTSSVGVDVGRKKPTGASTARIKKPKPKLTPVKPARRVRKK